MKLTLRNSRRSHGYTMMEVMLALGLIGLVISGIFQTQRMSVMISSEIITSQTNSMRTNALLDLLRRTFELVPGNSRVNLIVPRGNDGTSDFFLKDYPLAFAWPGVSAGAKSVILRTERAAGGGFQVVVLYLDEEATTSYENGNLNEKDTNPATGQARVQRLMLLEQVRSLVWAVNDEQKKEWVPDWPFENNRRPGLLELNMEMMDGEPIRLVYWIPVVLQPQQFANASMTGGGGSGGGGGGAGGGNPPTGQPRPPTLPGIQPTPTISR